MGANLLLNIGPQPDGSLPATALDRLKGVGEWTSKNGETVYATTAGDIAPQEWGVTTRKGDRLFVHVFDPSLKTLHLPITANVKNARLYCDGTPVKYEYSKEGVSVTLPESMDEIDTIIELTTK